MERQSLARALKNIVANWTDFARCQVVEAKVGITIQ
jgi:hypothetical protein